MDYSEKYHHHSFYRLHYCCSSLVIAITAAEVVFATKKKAPALGCSTGPFSFLLRLGYGAVADGVLIEAVPVLKAIYVIAAALVGCRSA